jgi:hypothetical protein
LSFHPGPGRAGKEELTGKIFIIALSFPMFQPKKKRVSLVNDFQCELEDGRMVGLAQYHLQPRSGQNSPIELGFSVWQVPSRIIRLEASKEITFWVGYQLRMFLSDFQGTSSEFLGDLKEGRLEFLLVSQSSYNSYFLVAPQQPVIGQQVISMRRIGVAEAEVNMDKVLSLCR